MKILSINEKVYKGNRAQLDKIVSEQGFCRWASWCFYDLESDGIQIIGDSITFKWSGKTKKIINL